MRDKTAHGRDRNVESVQTVLSSEQIPCATNEATMSSLSYDILDNCTAIPSSEQDSHKNDRIKEAKTLQNQLVLQSFLHSIWEVRRFQGI